MTAASRMSELEQAPAASGVRSLRSLYGEIVSHYEGCQVNPASLSDTWIQTLKHRGTLYSFEEMLQMLAPGNKVNFWIDDLHYLIDPTVVDLHDPIVRRLLELGESDFGAPRKDVRMSGRQVSSGFLHHLVYAAKIIRMVEARGIREPALLEIGGGLGGVAALLRQYFRERLTLYLVDIPETLMIQEWYLRACAPQAATAYKATTEPAVFQRGGLNFINAYVVESQDVPFDGAINADSMQEMTRATAQAYIRYLQKNLVPGGFWYFQNHHGHSALSVPEPSEYELDAHWTIHTAEMAYQMECCAESEQARFIFLRTDEPEDPQVRTLVLRVLWNGFVSGRIPNSRALVDELARVPGRSASGAAVADIARILQAHQVPIDRALIEPLQRSISFPPEAFLSLFQTEPVPTRAEQGTTQRHMEAVWCAQSELLQLMRHVATDGEGWSLQRLNSRLEALCQKHLLSLEGIATSEYWSAYVASILFVLRQRDAACRVLRACAGRSSSPFWLTRFAYLFARFQNNDEALAVLRLLDLQGPPDYYLALKRAELETHCGDPSASRRRLQTLEAQNGSELPRLVTLARTAVRTAALDIAWSACRKLSEQFPESRLAQLATVAKTARSSGAAREAAVFLKSLIGPSDQTPDDHDAALAHGMLLLELGEQEEGARLITAAFRSDSIDYYRLGWVGKAFQDARLDALADAYLAQSLALRPDSFLHREFVGNVYFAAQRYAKAQGHYQHSLAIKPYLRHIQAKALYCALPEAIRSAGLFGLPSELPLMFQRKQDFYHDVGLSNK